MPTESTGFVDKGETFINDVIKSLPIEYESKMFIGLNDIIDEIRRAKSMHPGTWHSNHEGYAVVLEEIDELWDEVKKKHADKSRLREEAIQGAAMLMRFAVELT